ncbi:MAG TPA: hypothetical protein VI146_08080 [Nitrososphaeraceae archaeon]
MNTKNVLMLVVLSAGMLTALTATATLQGQTAFADKKKCEDNSDNNCNDKSQNMKQKNECKIENENKDHSDKNTNSIGSQTLFCTTIGINPGHDFVLSLSHSDPVFGALP